MSHYRSPGTSAAFRLIERTLQGRSYELSGSRRLALDVFSEGGEAMTEGARYDIIVDETVRTHRDTREAALEAANVLKTINPSSKIVIRDLRTGKVIDPQKP